MISTKNIYMSICNATEHGHRLTPDELQRLQAHLMKMYKEIERVCDRHGLTICLAYGNVLGAMRHNGWIPWDDDLDVHMPRRDYELLLTKYAHELPPSYRVYAACTEAGPIARFAKVVDTDTVFVPLGGKRQESSGVFVDIFPVDSLEVGATLRLKKAWAYFLMYTATSVMQARGKSKEYKELMFSTRAGKMNWYFRQMWGKVFSFASPRKWHMWIDRASRNAKDTGWVHVAPELTMSYKPVPQDVFFPVKQVELPIGNVYLPHQPETYLDIIYRDWHRIPDDDKRWHHYVNEIHIP